ncbi:vWA domain-containing protein [Pectobacterium parmentieri]|uniref:VWA domain-containing protein n=1 Tax=Pectobacterium parmentieri TaxID=1905730 RepID=A0ABS0S0B8_PECPM|nr:VWA domain-containing protein [Pectobacterium parmentieri]MBI0471278.1 VWA domain-containing protein [Pectobacterium parmentieri]MBI0493890.1 VWA domain-containing protein [Pectobacterium parmentieri]MBI0554688.1 VWA domain-containing protein [Pectobacterium parmentieri]MBI0568156.1 VWA domain-containing protein [Pectobacterium parmentieri]MBI0573125.1 VWA domain-containing protein [Pectobacterium parmentieri]
MSELKKFQNQTARALPVIVLADTSGSMSTDGKIDALNQGLREMLESFKQESRLRAEIQVSVITFGGNQAELSLPLTPAHQLQNIAPLEANGMTPLGGALSLACDIIEDPTRKFQPVVVLISDGYPNDDWEGPFDRLVKGELTAEANRFAMAIGADADETMLSEFANDPEAPLFRAENARDIRRFFRAVSMSVSARSRSGTPNQSTPLQIPSVNDQDWEF